MSLKNPVTPRGIDPGSARLVAQRLNHYATPGSNKTQLPVEIPVTAKRNGHKNGPHTVFKRHHKH
jgi:hypothetical protein